MNELYIAIGKRIHETREKRGYAREGLAEQIGVSDGFLYEVETGRKGLSVENIYKLSQKLGVSTDYLIKGVQYNKHEDIMSLLDGYNEFEIEQMKNIILTISKFYKSQNKEYAVF